LGRIDKFISQTFSDGLDVPESCLTRPGAQHPDGLVHATQWRHINGLTTHGSSTSNTGGIFPRTRVDDGVDQNLKRVLRKKENTYLSCEQVNDFKTVLHNSHCHQFFAVVASMHH
ncbi:hypothetical protein EGW08_021155, partial [Elysia chlorotica]